MKVESKRLELLSMVETMPDVKVVAMDRYLRYFNNASKELKSRVIEFAVHSSAWDVLAMCLNYDGWHDGDKDLLIGVTNLFMDDCRNNVLK